MLSLVKFQYNKGKGPFIPMEIGNLSFPCLQAAWPSDKEEGHLVVHPFLLNALLVFDGGTLTGPGCLAG